MDALQLLINRTSCGKLAAPGPDAAQLRQIIQAAVRAPDHGRLQPWRFVVVEGEGLQRLGELFVTAAQVRDNNLSAEAREKFRLQPLRAPLILVVIAAPKTHPKIPAHEQYASAACAAYGALLAANALGFAGIWRTGDNASDDLIKQELGLVANEEIAGYLYLGTAAGNSNPLPSIDPDQFLSRF